MVENISPPSMNTADLFDPNGIVRLVLTKFLQGVDDMLPARVISYNRAKNIARVQPLILMVTMDNKQVKRAEIAAVPVLQLGGGGFVFSIPLKAGDLGWIKANDRDISLFKQFHNSAPPNTQRKHSFEDALFIPDVMMQSVAIAPEDANNLVIQNLAGTVKLALWSTFMKVIGRLGIGISPETSAIFHVGSTTMASIPWPRMTTGQRNAIASPKEGMVVWLTDTHGISTYNESTHTWS